ncbi:DNA-binding MarR family transcriptional regulator [Clostridium acetobutylicum]|uniref:Transcriptional regulator, MarR/EmrR family n=1 Tax=Clostridium acetobutylicum (strain ATCC 824 / DSM 792 / JCM 1419 / IAM 19013 / LMG 5710 / NBRC 13948 / NRRL B-527 / VKM B-1787 / 2291 / W) TaxID=272562 RepID=Q97DJ2_CLOAB|nr:MULTISPECIES: MarR family winged helix-turn-helix transcriptional regulator [Clostridium]AAK81411.1 Transcriptional regulator, MarR/EmrR family [Clostridium acetobutylicum ATCC 824]ADZ22526.1 Transcriptional regulator, MarR/EmrR family [Clostridium acetobutylicum EA 2018]AEI32880.1 MarR family transcriptional regulator [Clostridium acetobutylicum DSM 1731]AWV80918.1 MarR family transcriptional regulator [Clostridium acetobutylicum]MBC2393756.1 winged helix-turn-helix transcriptional regulat
MNNNTQNKTDNRIQLELKLGEQLNVIINASHALNVKTAAHFDSTLQPAAFLIVRWLFSFGPTNATVLSKSIAMDRSSVSRLVNQLKNMGYVKSEQSPSDRRGVLLSLTELGHQRTMNALKEKESAFYERIAKWDDSKLESFIELLMDFNGLENK